MAVARRPLERSLLDSGVLALALWTISTNVTAFAGGSLRALVAGFSLLLVSLLGLAVLRPKAANPGKGNEGSPLDRDPPAPATGRPRDRLFLWVLVLLAVGLTLTAHRPNPDGVHHLSLAVAATDDPSSPILAADTTGMYPGARVLVPAYKLQSIEMAGAAVHWLTRISLLVVFHLLFAPLAALLAILAYHRLFQLLSPRHALWSVAGIVVFLIAYGDTYTSFGNFSFVRLHQGKGVLVSVLLPLLIAYGIEYARQPGRRAWLLLAATQIAALGVSSTALWLAPVVGAVAVITGLPRIGLGAQVYRSLIGLSASIYLVLVGIYAQLTFVLPLLFRATDFTRDEFLANTWRGVFGTGPMAVAAGATILFAWAFCEGRIARRLCIVFPLVTALFFFNPLVVEVISKHLTSVETYWRIFWIVPLPTMAGLILVSPLRLRLPGLPWLPPALFALALLIVTTVLPHRSILAAANGTSLGFPRPKVPEEPYETAGWLAQALPAGSRVLGPEPVTAWLITFPKHPDPLLFRHMFINQRRQMEVAFDLYVERAREARDAQVYLSRQLHWYRPVEDRFPVATPWAERVRSVIRETGFDRLQFFLDYETRLVLKRYVSGQARPEDGPGPLRRAIELYRIDAVSVTEDNPWLAEIDLTLDAASFRQIPSRTRFAIWVADG
jgi:hypothetical protein